MLVVGVCGPSAADIANRLSRHITGAEFVALKTPVENLEVSVLGIVHAASTFTRQGQPEPRTVLVAVDPPDSSAPQHLPLRKFLASRPDGQLLPFYLHTEPPEPGCLDYNATYQDFADALEAASETRLNITGQAHMDPVITPQVSETMLTLRTRQVEYRSLVDEQKRSELAMGEGMVIVVTAAKGGSGKSTFALIAANLMTNWAADTASSVLLVDANIGQPVLVGLTWDTPRKDIRWAMTQIEAGRSPDDVLVEVAYPIASGVRTAARQGGGGGGKTHAIVSTLRGAGRKITIQPEATYQLVCAAARKYDYVIVDTPPIDPTSMETLAEKFVLPAADELLFICDCEYQSTQNAFLFYDSITTSGRTRGLDRHISWVLNKSGEHPNFDLQMMRSLAAKHGQESSPPRILGEVPYSRKLKEELNAGLNIIPELSEVDTAVASVLGQLLGEPDGTILPQAARKKSRLGVKLRRGSSA